MQVAWRGAPVQAREIVPLKSVPGVSCRLKQAVWPAVTEAESVPVSANAGAELAKMFRTCGEPGASSVTERVSLRGPEKMGGKSYARGAIGIGGDGGDGAAGGVDERVLELGSGEVARSSAARARAIARALEWRGAASGERVGRESSVFCRGLEAPVQGTRVK
jgi:hypothetical protein